MHEIEEIRHPQLRQFQADQFQESRIRVENAAKSFSGRVVVDVEELVLGDQAIEGLIGPNGAGKTTLVESMLFEGGVIDRRGDVDLKNTVSDFHQIEQENQTSMYSSVIYTEYKDKKIKILQQIARKVGAVFLAQ